MSGAAATTLTDTLPYIKLGSANYGLTDYSKPIFE
jgi:hypothetical protein